MSIAALDELKREIHQAVLFGNSILDDNFRLQRLQRTLQPLGSYAEPMKMIADLLQKLNETAPQQRSATLLNLAGLLQAVETVLLEIDQPQPDVLDEREINCALWQRNSLTGQQLHRIREALTSKGSGRLEVLLAYHRPLKHRKAAEEAAAKKEAPAAAITEPPITPLDLRLLPLLFVALQDPYIEVQELAASWLQEFGPSLLPLLKERWNAPQDERTQRSLLPLYIAMASDAERTELTAMALDPEVAVALRSRIIETLPLADETLLQGLLQDKHRTIRSAAFDAYSAKDEYQAAAYLLQTFAAAPDAALADTISDCRSDYFFPWLKRTIQELLLQMHRWLWDQQLIVAQESEKDAPKTKTKKATTKNSSTPPEIPADIAAYRKSFPLKPPDVKLPWPLAKPASSPTFVAYLQQLTYLLRALSGTYSTERRNLQARCQAELSFFAAINPPYGESAAWEKALKAAEKVV